MKQNAECVYFPSEMKQKHWTQFRKATLTIISYFIGFSIFLFHIYEKNRLIWNIFPEIPKQSTSENSKQISLRVCYLDAHLWLLTLHFGISDGLSYAISFIKFNQTKQLFTQDSKRILHIKHLHPQHSTPDNMMPHCITICWDNNKNFVRSVLTFGLYEFKEKGNTMTITLAHSLLGKRRTRARVGSIYTQTLLHPAHGIYKTCQIFSPGRILHGLPEDFPSK